jgi:GNAT superfamily N-acetyltransferase
MRLRIVTHVEHPELRGKLPDLWPEFMHHDSVVTEFWPQLYEVYPDFQLWVLDGRRPIGYACAIVIGIVPPYRGHGVSAVVLNRMASVAAAHGLDSLIAPVRPTWKERYPLTPIDRYVEWRRGDGMLYDPWLRTHERLGAELLAPAPSSMTVGGTRAEWEEWTGLQFPEDGDYVVPGALVPVRFEDGVGTYVEPNVWMRHPVEYY